MALFILNGETTGGSITVGSLEGNNSIQLGVLSGSGPQGAGIAGTDGLGWTGGSYDGGTGIVTFTSDDGLGFATGDLRGTNGTNGTNGTDGLGWTGGSYDSGTGIVTFTSDDGLGFATGDLRGADGADGGTVTVQDEGTPLTTTANTLNFVGDGVVASGTGTTKTITISGGGLADGTTDGALVKWDTTTGDYIETSFVEDDSGNVGIGTASPAEKLHVDGIVRVDDNLVIGTSGKGIDFSADGGSTRSGVTTSAQILDDYEEGTWSGTVSDTSGNTSSTTFTGTYTKIGRQVTISWQATNIDTTGLTATNNIRIGGLPFIPTGGQFSAANLNDCAMDDGTNMRAPVFRVFETGGSPVIQVNMNRHNDVSIGLKVSELTSGAADLNGTMVYQTA
jgi:hypothetical protein